MSAALFPLVEAGRPLERGLDAFRAAMAADPRLARGRRDPAARRVGARARPSSMSHDAA